MGTKQYWHSQMPVNQGIYETSSTQKADLGQRLQIGDRVFYYAKSGGIISAGSTVSTAADDSNAGLGVNGLQANGASGAYTVKLSLENSASKAANYYKEGYLAFVSGSGTAGTGQNELGIYRISGHASMAVSCSAAAVTCSLYDSLHTTYYSASATNQVVQILRNLFDGVTEGGVTAVTGIGVAPVLVASGYYFWLQTWGPAAVYAVAATVRGGNYTFASNAGTAACGWVKAYVAADMSFGGMAGIGLAAGTARTTWQDGIIFLTIIP